MPKLLITHGRGVMMLLALGSLTACATRPANLDQAATAIQAARGDPTVMQYAPDELDKAQADLDRANNAWETGQGQKDAATGATIAMQQVEIARATAEQRKDQAEIGQLGTTRETVLRQSAEEEVATLQKELASLKARQTARGIELTMGDVLFGSGEATLEPGAVQQMSTLAQFLQQHPDQNVRIEGFTDSVGSSTYNLGLSQRRADAVRNALLADGVEPRQITAVGLGEGSPVAPNSTAAGRQQNRRVNIVIANPPAA
jgi:outer membrane protein OmpA-like peptidoglycan-associated protein